MTYVGLPDEVIAGVRQSPYWQAGTRLAPTLAYDAAIMGVTAGSRPKGTAALARRHLCSRGPGALRFCGRPPYVDTLGFEVDVDMVTDGFHWLVVHAPEQPEVPLMLVVPGPPVVDGELAEQIQSLVATGHLGPGAFATNDCWETYRELNAKGVEFIEEPEERFYRIDAAFRDPFGNHWRLTQRKELTRPTS